MLRKNIVKLYMVSLLLCMFFCGCSKKNLDNNKTADNVTSTTDSVIENTDIVSVDSSESSEITTTEVSTTNSPTTEIATGSSSANKDDNTTNNEGNNGNVTTQTSGSNSGNSGTTPATTENPSTTEDIKPEPPATTENPTTEYNKPEKPSTTEESKPETPTTTEEPKPEEPSTTESPTTEEHKECQHKWILVDETIHHDAVYEEQYVCVRADYDEKVYEWHSFCNGCGVDLTAMFPDRHYSSHTLTCQGGSSYHAEPVLVDTIHHDPVYEWQTVCVMQAWDEIVTHTVCSICGYQIN